MKGILRVCEVCKSLYEDKSDHKVSGVPKVCSGRCFAIYLENGKGIDLEELLKNSKFKKNPGFQEPEHRKKIQFRSNYEKEFFYWVADNHRELAFYEYLIFENGKYSYCPDFIIHTKKSNSYVFVEVKGLWEPGAKRKVKTFREYLINEFKTDSLIMVDKDLLRRLKH